MGKIEAAIEPSHIDAARFSDSALTPYFQHFRAAADCYAKNFFVRLSAEGLLGIFILQILQ